jgi:hypothetical protein
MKIKLKDQNGNVKKFTDINFSQMLSMLDNKLDESISYKLKINNIKAGKIEVFQNEFGMMEEDELINIKNFWELMKKINSHDFEENVKKIKIDLFVKNYHLKLKLNLKDFDVIFDKDCAAFEFIIRFIYKNENLELFKIIINEDSPIPYFISANLGSNVLINYFELDEK